MFSRKTSAFLILAALGGAIVVSQSASASGFSNVYTDLSKDCKAAVRRVAEGQIVGAYTDTSNTDPEVVKAARFAIKTERQKVNARISLLSIKRAEVQVVAGLNYRLCMRVKVKGKTRNVMVVVYKNLKQKYSLTSWVADGCKKQ